MNTHTHTHTHTNTYIHTYTLHAIHAFIESAYQDNHNSSDCNWYTFNVGRKRALTVFIVHTIEMTNDTPLACGATNVPSTFILKLV